MKAVDSKIAAAGDVYGRYTILGLFKENPSDRRILARVQCSCGSPPRYVRVDTLRNGTSQSCGCLHKERVTTHGLWSNPLSKVWRSMIARCTDPKNHKFARYGGRGISVCERWLTVENFVHDMSPGYAKGMTLDRRDNDGNYDPDNCHWATARQQTRNYSRNVLLEHQGKTLCVADWAAELGIDAKVLYDRVARGWNAARVLTTPIKR
jgi:hypothetical protein